MPSVFISYARENREAAERLAAALEQSRVDVWFDKNLAGGAIYRDEIPQRLQEARSVIVLWSAESVGSRWVRAEASAAFESAKLVPLLLKEGLQPPFPFGEANTLPFWDWDGSVAHPRFQPLLDSLSSSPGGGAGGPVPADGGTGEPTRRALLIGLDAYTAGADFMPLTTPEASVRRLEALLQSKEGGEFAVQSLYSPGQQQLQTALLTFFRAEDVGPDDMQLLYFAGHARVGEENDLYLCPQNAASDILDATAISMVWLANRAINKSQAGNLIILLDCLFKPAPGQSQECDVGAVLHANLGQGKAKYLLTSSSVMDADVLEGGPITRLAQAIATGIETWEAAYGDDVLTAEELCRYGFEQLSATSPAAEPRYWGFNTSSGQAAVARRAGGLVPHLQPRQSERAFFAAVRSKLDQGRIVPFIGDGIYGTGPLSSFRLVGDMARTAGLEAGLKIDERYPLATAAEYLQEVLAEREDFLTQFHAILASQSAKCRPAAVHQLVEGMASPWVTVSATYDWQLESRLEAAGLPFAVVAHVVGSPNRADDGKMVLVARGPEPLVRVCAADAWTLSELGAAKDRLIYKLVGSPHLNALLDPELELDTVVVTESDHLRFLSRLENGQTGFPPALARPLQSRCMLFLGYNLDVWHYRLVGHVFGSGGLVQCRHRFAVRTATSPLEERFWTRLVASQDRLRSDSEAFVHALRNLVPPA